MEKFKHRYAQIFVSSILCFVALVYNSFFSLEEPFYGNYSILDSHTNTVIPTQDGVKLTIKPPTNLNDGGSISHT